VNEDKVNMDITAAVKAGVIKSDAKLRAKMTLQIDAVHLTHVVEDDMKAHLVTLGEWSEAQHEELERELKEAVRVAAKAGEAIGTLGQSAPSKREIFEGVFKEPDWRLIEQRREMGV
jgi:hypothetical protein